MLGRIQYLVNWALLYDLALIHHGHVVRDVCDDTEIMGNKQISKP